VTELISRDFHVTFSLRLVFFAPDFNGYNFELIWQVDHIIRFFPKLLCKSPKTLEIPIHTRALIFPNCAVTLWLVSTVYTRIKHQRLILTKGNELFCSFFFSVNEYLFSHIRLFTDYLFFFPKCWALFGV
jgi:hypothetical protein